MWRVPIVVGPMAQAAGGRLAGAVSHAGGLGFIGAGYYSRDTLTAEINAARAVVGENDGRLPIGIGFLAWRLDDLPRADAEALVHTALGARPTALWFSYGAPGSIERWCAYAKQAAQPAPPSMFVTASTLEAFHQLQQHNCIDAIVVQGLEAGGHGLGSGQPRDELLLDVVRTTDATRRPKLLSAGGIADGRDIAAQLTLGADAVVLGTRFLLTPEAAYADAQKQLLLQAQGYDTVRSMAFDDARGTTNWPAGIDGRGLRSATVDDYEAAAQHLSWAEQQAQQGRVPGIEARQERYRTALAQGETERMITWAGTGVGAMHDIVPAAALVERLAHEARRALADAHARLDAPIS